MVKLESAIGNGGTENAQQQNSPVLQDTLAIAESLRTLPMDINLWQAQNIWNDLFRRSDKDYWSPEWKLAFKKLGEALYISVDELVTDEGVTAF
jgi:hypothetical protein